jgi:hypothetical protein
MKLTNEMRKTFVRAIMADVPQVDYREKASKLLQEDSYAKFPNEVKKVYDDSHTRHFLNVTKVYFNILGYVNFYGSSGYGLPKEVLDAINKLGILHQEQESVRSELINKLNGAANGASTTQKLKFMLPDFESYIPKEVAKPVGQPPAVINIVGDFLALGWKQPTQATA